MTDDLYERYKEALRNGHVAVLRGNLPEAIEAYRFAAEMAPSRALPHTSLGGVYMRLGYLDEALTEYAAAVSRAPEDEGALLGQAEALLTAARRSDAAEVLDHVAEVQRATGRLPEAADTLRRGLELEESPERSRRQRSLVREIRLSVGDRDAEQLLARALRLREEPNAETEAGRLLGALLPGVGLPSLPPIHSAPADGHGVRADAVSPEMASQIAPDEELAAEQASEPAVAELEVGTPIAVATVEKEREAVGVMAGLDEVAFPGALGGDEGGPQSSADEMMSAVEAAEAAGDEEALQPLLTRLARAYAREGRFEAGLDAAHRLLQHAPSDVDAHLVLVELYLARHWDALAAEKLKLLNRIAELNEDEETRQRLCAVASRAFPADQSLDSLCL
jgi:tetratricopeptide (TPR) repeat protein